MDLVAIFMKISQLTILILHFIYTANEKPDSDTKMFKIEV